MTSTNSADIFIWKWQLLKQNFLNAVELKVTDLKFWDCEWNCILFRGESRFCIWTNGGRIKINRLHGYRRNLKFAEKSHKDFSRRVRVFYIFIYRKLNSLSNPQELVQQDKPLQGSCNKKNCLYINALLVPQTGESVVYMNNMITYLTFVIEIKKCGMIVSSFV